MMIFLSVELFWNFGFKIVTIFVILISEKKSEREKRCVLDTGVKTIIGAKISVLVGT